mmetsp:Transcript_10985/g.16484  ORF Transcript_10985/g.16484 Transcript_10985/m.16484 type:complete len:277 (+) Transcript_10985:532-1362(+)
MQSEQIGTRRKEAFGQGWQEHFVDVERASKSLSVGSAVSQSLSYVTLSNFASIDECSVLQASAMEIKDSAMKYEDNSIINTHVLGATEAAHHNCTRYSVAGLLDAHSKDVSSAFLHRLLGFLEGDGCWGGHGKIEEMSQLAELIFGSRCDLKKLKVTWYSEPDEQGTMHPEPKVNIYSDGGFFASHEDGMHPTLLVVLDDSFEGGGTAFYREEEDDLDADAEEKNDDKTIVPDSVATPCAGTGIIWGANLKHMALPITKGTRSVYVGSFDLNQDDS